MIWPSFYSDSPSEEATVVSKKLSEEEKATLQVTLLETAYEVFSFLGLKFSAFITIKLSICCMLWSVTPIIPEQFCSSFSIPVP